MRPLLKIWSRGLLHTPLLDESLIQLGCMMGARKKRHQKSLEADVEIEAGLLHCLPDSEADTRTQAWAASRTEKEMCSRRLVFRAIKCWRPAEEAMVQLHKVRGEFHPGNMTELDID